MLDGRTPARQTSLTEGKEVGGFPIITRDRVAATFITKYRYLVFRIFEQE